MKIAIITDQHFGARKNSKLFHDYFLKFYNNIFFPFLEKEGITTVVDMGDTFDNRTGINFNALAWAKDNYFDRLKALGCTVHTIVGNHTAYYKNTNDINAVDLLLREYDNVKIYAETQEVKLGDTKVLFVPWINNHFMEHGMETTPFDRFEKVYSGHYHCRSVQEPVHYLGNPYEMFWGDVNDTERGFHVWDTDTFEHTPVNNPYRLHHLVYYNDTDYQLFDARELENKIVKVIVKQKSNTTQFEKFIDKLYATNVAELKIVENFQIQEATDFEAFESEDTISVLNRYIEEAEIKLDKSKVQKMVQNIYQEACELI